MARRLGQCGGDRSAMGQRHDAPKRQNLPSPSTHSFLLSVSHSSFTDTPAPCTRHTTIRRAQAVGYAHVHKSILRRRWCHVQPSRLRALPQVLTHLPSESEGTVQVYIQCRRYALAYFTVRDEGLEEEAGQVVKDYPVSICHEPSSPYHMSPPANQPYE